MGFYRSFAGTVRTRVLTADVPACLQMLDREHISASGIQVKDSVTLEMTVSRKDLTKLKELCRRKGYTLEIVNKKGIFWLLRAMTGRPVFVGGMVLLTILAVCLPGRILFVETDGNDAVPARYLLEQAEDIGLKFWARRREVRSEQIKNGLLEAIPQLQWVGVNTYGCRAVITVRERLEQPEEKHGAPVSHITASRDGVIRSCTVIRGFGSCSVGQAVRQGDILISGYTDCGLTYMAERAEGEILAQTKRMIRIKSPKSCRIQSQTDRSETKFSLLLGKKRINFYKGSGISGGTCDKMYSKYVLTLPGRFALPVALVRETTVFCYLTEADAESPEQMLKNAATDYLSGQMTDGTILRRSETIMNSDDVFQLIGVYDCLEDIGTVQEEKIGEING